MEDKQALMPVDLPVTDEKKEKPRVNCLQDILIELMNERRVGLADIHRATHIPMTTIYEWYSGASSRQLADKNLLELARFFNVSLDYLLFGIGTDEPKFNLGHQEGA